MKLRFWWFLIAVGFIGLLGIGLAHADGLKWDIPGGIGTIQLPTKATDISPLAGYDFVQKEVISGASAPLLTLFKDFNGYVGAVGEFHTQAPNIQPYLSIGIDATKYVPGASFIQNLSIQGFVRYVASTSQHLGAGGAVSYKW